MENLVKGFFEIIFSLIFRAIGLDRIDICPCIKCKCSCSIFLYLNIFLIFYCIQLFLSVNSIRFISSQTIIYKNNIKSIKKYYYNLTNNKNINNNYNYNYDNEKNIYYDDIITIINYKHNEKIFLLINFLIQFIFVSYIIYLFYLYKRKRNIFNYIINYFPKKSILICIINIIFSCIFNFYLSNAMEIWEQLYDNNKNKILNEKDLFIIYNSNHLLNQVMIIFFSFINLFISIFFYCFVKRFLREIQINNIINNNIQIINIPTYTNNNNYLMYNVQYNQQNNNIINKPVSNININEPINQACPVPNLYENVPIYNNNISNTSIISDNSQTNINN